jgi:hypothetical protein
MATAREKGHAPLGMGLRGSPERERSNKILCPDGGRGRPEREGSQDQRGGEGEPKSLVGKRT